MALLTRKRTILAKIETTYGTDPTPTGAANAILVRNMSITPLNAENVSRDLVRPYLGASEQLIASAYVSIEFEVEMAGSGTAGTAPAYGSLLQACGMSETVVAVTSVTYAPVSSAFKSVTLYYNVDGVLHKITGARGNVELTINSRQIPVFKFTFTGLYNAPTDTAAPSVTYTSFQTPLAANSDNTTGFSLFTYAGAMESMSINFNNAIQYRSLIGAEDVLMTDRQVSGQVMFEAPTIATKDFFSLALGTTLGALDITHGTTAGNKVQITSSRVDVSNPSYQDQNGIQMLQVPMTFVPSTSGNDEISIVVK
jgi:hypothetical protein